MALLYYYAILIHSEELELDVINTTGYFQFPLVKWMPKITNYRVIVMEQQHFGLMQCYFFFLSLAL